MIQIIGGKLDGHQTPVRVLQLEEKDEKYLLMEFFEGKTKHCFYLKTDGPTPAEAMKTYKERTKLWPK
jgi:hypothetical protein